MNEPATSIGHGEIIELFEETSAFWREWIGRSRYRGRWREMVERSAITLKLMTYAPSGALVAAPTAGLPEQVGGERNWDYRYTWIRDASFSIYALLGLGLHRGGRGLRAVGARPGGEPPGGQRRRRWPSCTGSTAARIWSRRRSTTGRATAARSRSGSATAPPSSCSSTSTAKPWTPSTTAPATASGVVDAGWSALTGLLDWVVDNWDQPDEGVWETRGGQQPFVYGRLMCWVALDRGLRLAERLGRPGAIDRWREARDAIYTAIMDKGWNAKLEAFTQFEGSDVLDASILLMPLMGFIEPRDPKWQSTLAAMDETLVIGQPGVPLRPRRLARRTARVGGHLLALLVLVRRRPRPIGSTGRLAARRSRRCSPMPTTSGLYSEEIGMTGEQLGNFPQAFTHLSLINAALNLDYQLDHGAGKVAVIN